MKQSVYFEQNNAGDYLAQVMHLAENQEQAEYEVILKDGDRLITTELGTTLVRGSRHYMQQTYMKRFSSVCFIEHTSDPQKDTVVLKMLGIGDCVN